MQRAAGRVRAIGGRPGAGGSGGARPGLRMDGGHLGTLAQPGAHSRGVVHLGRRRPGAWQRTGRGTAVALPYSIETKTDPHSDSVHFFV
jgi:hypothetical protein